MFSPSFPPFLKGLRFQSQLESQGDKARRKITRPAEMFSPFPEFFRPSKKEAAHSLRIRRALRRPIQVHRDGALIDRNLSMNQIRTRTG